MIRMTNRLYEDLKLKFWGSQKTAERSSSKEQLKLSEHKLLRLIEQQIKIFEEKLTFITNHAS